MLNPLYIFTVATNNQFAATDMINIPSPYSKPMNDRIIACSPAETCLVSCDLTAGDMNELGKANIVDRYTIRVVFEKLKIVKQTIILKTPTNIRT